MYLHITKAHTQTTYTPHAKHTNVPMCVLLLYIAESDHYLPHFVSEQASVLKAHIPLNVARGLNMLFNIGVGNMDKNHSTFVLFKIVFL